MRKPLGGLARVPSPAALVLAVLLPACGPAGEGAAGRFVPMSGRMPVIAGTALSGEPLAARDYAGKVVLLNFWNQDCPPCLEEMPLLEAGWRDLRSRGLFVLGIVFVGGNWANDPAAARAFLDREGITYPSIMDEGARWEQEMGVVGIPTTIVVDRSGRMRYRLLGRVQPGDAERMLDELGG